MLIIVRARFALMALHQRLHRNHRHRGPTSGRLPVCSTLTASWNGRGPWTTRDAHCILA